MKRLAFLLVLLLVIAVPLPATSAGDTSRVSLAGTTRLSGRTAGYVSVSVPKDVRISNPLFDPKDVRIDGQGDFVGFALVPSEDEDPVLLGGRLPRSSGRRVFLFDVGSFFADSISRKKIHLHMGDYRLYLLPGSGRAQIELHLDGLEGTLELHPQEQVPFEAQVTAPKYETPGSNYYAAGGTSTLGGRGLVFGTVWTNTSLHGVTSADLCFWRNEPSPVGYAPECGSTPFTDPGNLWGYSGTIDYGAGTDRPFRMYYGAWQPFESGFKKPGLRYGHSVVVESASAVESIGSLGLWLTYD